MLVSFFESSVFGTSTCCSGSFSTCTGFCVPRHPKIAVAKIINDGRKAIRPKRGRFLYIPLSRRAKEKAYGRPISAKFKFGKDYILTKFARAVKGTKFIDKNVRKASIQITKEVIKEIRRIF